MRGSGLTSVDVGDCRLGAAGAAAVLAATVEGCPQLSTLAMYMNGIGDAGACTQPSCEGSLLHSQSTVRR